MVIPPTAVSAFCRRSPPFHCESVVSGEQQNVGRSCRGRVARAGLLGLTEGGSRGEGGGKPAAEGGSPSPSIWRKTPPLPTQTGNLICAGWPTDRPTAAATAPNSLLVAQPPRLPSRRSPERKQKSASQLPHPCSRLSVRLTTHSSMFWGDFLYFVKFHLVCCTQFRPSSRLESFGTMHPSRGVWFAPKQGRKCLTQRCWDSGGSGEATGRGHCRFAVLM